jgi:hypothetical protein
MPRLIRVARRGVLEILGLEEPGSPNPRRNTSNEMFEALTSGNKAETCIRLFPLCIRFVSASTHIHPTSGNKQETRGSYLQ